MAQLRTFRQQADQRLLGMRSDRYSYWTHWRELSQYTLPRRGRWLITPNQGNRGSPRNQAIIDSTGTVAARTLTSAMIAGVASPTRPWFRLAISDFNLGNSSAAVLWLDECRRRMDRVFAESNFYNSMAVVFEELIIFGTAVMLIYESFENIIQCYTLTAGEYYLALSDKYTVDTVYREFTLTVQQLQQWFGLARMSDTARSLYENGQLDKEMIVCHGIEPNTRPLAGAEAARGKAYREIYWEWGSSSNLYLSVKGYDEFLGCCPRWHVNGNDAYGRSPGMDALGDIKQLQVEQKRKAQGIDKLVNPPMVADPQLKNYPASSLPGGITYISGASNVGFKPAYQVDPKLQDMKEDIAEVQKRVREAFFADVVMMISQLDTVRSATEIQARQQEKMLMLGPVLERLNNEALKPAITRTFNIMSRHGLFPPAPPELQGQEIEIEFVSMLAQAQRAVETTSLERLAAFTGNLAGGKPEVLDRFDADEAVEIYGDYLGVNPRVIVPMAKVEQVRADRRKKEQMQAAASGALTAAEGAKVLSSTDVGGGQSALQRMIGG